MANPQLRGLISVRLSRLTDESTSPERQREQGHGYLKAYGYSLAHITEDTDVSGRVPPVLRPGLGPWLTDPEKLAQWDILIVAKLDRLLRSISGLSWLMKFCEEEHKSFASIAEHIDLSSPSGRLQATILAGVAAFERERTSERIVEAREFMQREGRWPGGRIPYGYQPEKQGDGYALVPDLDAAAIIGWIASGLISGRSRRDLARELTTKNIPTPHGKPEWSGYVLAEMMKSPVLKGNIVQHYDRVGDGEYRKKGTPEVLRGADGVAVKREPVLSDDIWDQVQEALKSSARGASGRRANASLLLQVAFCGKCGSPLYLFREGSLSYGYYRCGSVLRHNPCGAKYVRDDILEPLTEEMLLDDLGEVPMQVRRVIPGEDNSRLIAELEEGITNLEAQSVDDPMKATTYVRMISKLEERRDKLKTQPVRKEATEWEPVVPPQTFAQHWGELDKQGRHNFLRSAGVRILVRHLDPAEPAAPDESARWTDHGRYLMEQRELPEAAMTPVPEVPGSVIRRIAHGLVITTYLGNLAELRYMAAQAN
ncbi:MAG: recombinase family protein [Streptosporangiaceae bacterium]